MHVTEGTCFLYVDIYSCFHQPCSTFEPRMLFLRQAGIYISVCIQMCAQDWQRHTYVCTYVHTHVTPPPPPPQLLGLLQYQDRRAVKWLCTLSSYVIITRCRWASFSNCRKWSSLYEAHLNSPVMANFLVNNFHLLRCVEAQITTEGKHQLKDDVPLWKTTPLWWSCQALHHKLLYTHRPSALQYTTADRLQKELPTLTLIHTHTHTSNNIISLYIFTHIHAVPTMYLINFMHIHTYIQTYIHIMQVHL